MNITVIAQFEFVLHEGLPHKRDMELESAAQKLELLLGKADSELTTLSCKVDQECSALAAEEGKSSHVPSELIRSVQILREQLTEVSSDIQEVQKQQSEVMLSIQSQLNVLCSQFDELSNVTGEVALTEEVKGTIVGTGNIRMMGDERNFRSQFYGKVGLHEVEEKRSVEALLKEQPLNGKKFAHFAQRSIVPTAYRKLVWKLMLGITPRYAESQDYVTQQQTLMYEELWYALKALGLASMSFEVDGMNGHDLFIINSDSKKGNVGGKTYPETPFPEHHVLMWLMSEAKLLYNPRQQLKSRENLQFIAIARKVSVFFDNPVEVYQVCSSLWSLIVRNQTPIMDALQEAIGILRKEHDVYHLHLLKIGLFANPLLEELCLSLFCDILPESAIEKILDKVIAKAFRILSFVIVALLVHLRRSIASVTSVEGVRNLMSQIRKEEADVIITSALEQWVITQSGYVRSQRITPVP